jgi:dTMP kinase
MRVSSHAGLFITLEGPDGSGKSTQAHALAGRIRAETGRDVQLRREPGSTPVGEQIRRVLLDTDMADRDALTDALLFNAARHEHVEQEIRPLLERGVVVVCDRYADSTLAYQGYGGGVALDELRLLQRLATAGLQPVRTVLLDLPVSAGLSRRLTGDAADLTRFEVNEAMGADFHERVRAGYLEMASAEPARWRVLEAGRPPEAVAESVWEAVADLFD